MAVLSPSAGQLSPRGFGVTPPGVSAAHRQRLDGRGECKIVFNRSVSVLYVRARFSPFLPASFGGFRHSRELRHALTRCPFGLDSWCSVRSWMRAGCAAADQPRPNSAFVALNEAPKARFPAFGIGNRLVSLEPDTLLVNKMRLIRRAVFEGRGHRGGGCR